MLQIEIDFLPKRISQVREPQYFAVFWNIIYIEFQA